MHTVHTPPTRIPGSLGYQELVRGRGTHPSYYLLRKTHTALLYRILGCIKVVGSYLLDESCLVRAP
jgi:hypothetical protein